MAALNPDACVRILERITTPTQQGRRLVCEGCSAQLRVMTAREVACPFCRTLLPAALEEDAPGWQRVSHADIFGRASALPVPPPRPASAVPASPEAPPEARQRFRFDPFDPERTQRPHLLLAEEPAEAAPVEAPAPAARLPRIEPERPHERRPRQPTPPRLRALTPHDIIDVPFELPGESSAAEDMLEEALEEEVDPVIPPPQAAPEPVDAVAEVALAPAPVAPAPELAAQPEPAAQAVEALLEPPAPLVDDVDVPTLPMLIPPAEEADEAPSMTGEAIELEEAPRLIAPPALPRPPRVEPPEVVAQPQAVEPPEPMPVTPTYVEPTRAAPPDRSRELRTVVEAAPRPASGRRRDLWLLAALIAVGGFVGGYATRDAGPTAPAVVAPVGALAPSAGVAQIPREQLIDEVTQSARLAVALATTVDPAKPRNLRAAAAEFVQREEWGRAVVALDMLHASEPHADQAERLTHARALSQTRQHGRARALVLDAMLAAPDDPALVKLLRDSITEDEALRPATVTLALDDQLDTIHALGGGRSIVLRLSKGEQSVAAFKPHQREWSLGWRAEIAADLLCDVIACPFTIPRNQPARISRDDFEAMYGRKDSPKQRAYRERFGELIWVTEAGPDGVARDYLYGTLKEWVPGFVGWPIEHVETWQHLLDLTTPAKRLDEPIGEALSGMKPLAGGEHWRLFMKEREGLQTRGLAHQLSALLTFDYLTTNWDRFSSAEQFYGVNNQLLDGKFLSLDNGAAFYVNRMMVMEGRLRLVSRFDKRMIAAIRALDRETMNTILFPEQSAEAQARLKVFWDQRERLLKRVDALVKEHGEEAVYAF